MRRILSYICLVLILGLIPLSQFALSGLPVDTGAYAGKKYAGWNGVLQAWICCNWSPGGSFISWLNNCAAEFEKQHDGVYIEFTPVSAETMNSMRDCGLPLPDMVFFSPGVLTDASLFSEAEIPAVLRTELQDSAHAVPVAMGGYIWVYNPALCEGPPADKAGALPMTIPADDDGHSFATALVGLISGSTPAQIELPDAGIDLGLPANAADRTLTIADDALDRFIEGELPYLPVSQKELARLVQLQEDGRGPDWQCSTGGEFSWADQLLLGAALLQDNDKEKLCSEFIDALLEEEAQTALKEIGAFSVTGKMIHGEFSPYVQMDAQLCSRPLAVMEFFSEHSIGNTAEIIRAYCLGEAGARETIAKLGLSFSLHIHPN